MKNPVTGQPDHGDDTDVLERLPATTAGSTKSGATRSKAKNNDETDSEAQHRRALELPNPHRRSPIVDSEKVRAIKAALNNGTYEIKADNIADKMITLETQLESLDGSE